MSVPSKQNRASTGRSNDHRFMLRLLSRPVGSWESSGVQMFFLFGGSCLTFGERLRTKLAELDAISVKLHELWLSM